jgi:Zn-dependent protease with chaperone function
MDPVKIARKKSDLLVLFITFIATVLVLILFSAESITLGIIIVISLVAVLFYIRMFQISLLGNSLRVQNGKHKFLKSAVDEIQQYLSLPPIDVYITQNPTLNAFAIGYMRPYSIVLNSSVVEELTEGEVKAILIHEVGHIAYKHTIITSYLGPLSNVPIVGQLVTWIFGFWSRRAELTCDRLAVAYTKDPYSVISALIRIHTGSAIGGFMDAEGVIYQDIKGKSVFRSLSQSLSTHPFLVTRVREIINFSLKNNITLPQNVIDYLRQ